MDSKTQIKAALLAQLVKTLGKEMASDLKDDDAEVETVEVEMAGPPEMEDDEMMDDKAKRMKKLKAMAEEC